MGVRWVGERAILVVVTQCLLLLTRTHYRFLTEGVPKFLVVMRWLLLMTGAHHS